MNNLTEYQRRRLALADLIRTVVHIARDRGNDAAERQARQLLARLAEDQFRLAVVGQFSRGKSTLMNAILGAEYLPTGALPMTSVVTTVRYGTRPRALVRRRDSGLPIEVPLAKLAAYVAHAGAERSALRVTSAEVEAPAELLRLGFAFVDTPGIGSVIEVNTATTRRLLPQADAVIFVTGFDSALTHAEEEFLTEAGRDAGQLFLVINKRDLVSSDSAAEVANFVRQRLVGKLPVIEPRIFGLSALQALEARLRADDEALAASGLPSFEAALTEFLTLQKAKVFLGNIAARAARLVTGLHRDLRLGRLAADGGPDPGAVQDAFGAAIADLGARQRTVMQQIAERVAAGLPAVLAERRPGWHAELRDQLAPLATEALPDGADLDLLPAARDQVEREGQEIATGWLSRRAAELPELLISLAADEIGTLLELCRYPGVLGAGIAGLPLAGDRGGQAGWSAEDLPAAAVPAVGWSLPFQPGRRSRLRRAAQAGDARQLLSGALTAATSTFGELSGQALQQAASAWVERLREQARRQTREEADRFRHNLRTPPIAEDLSALDDLARALAGFRVELGGWNPASDDGTAVAPSPAAVDRAPAPDGSGGCVICAQLEATLTSRLFRDQLRLATRERDQAQHARIGGYCQLHTWQYSAMASPVGISAGYAGLAGSLADAIDAVSSDSATIDELARSMTGLAERTENCTVCATLANSEHAAAIDIASRAPASAETMPLCLHHLAAVLAARPAPAVGRAMTARLGTALRRRSEDMRAYALKREALRNARVTEAESQAYLDALHLLAGLPSLARPAFRPRG